MGGLVGSLPTEKQKFIFKSRWFNQSGLQAKKLFLNCQEVQHVGPEHIKSFKTEWTAKKQIVS